MNGGEKKGTTLDGIGFLDADGSYIITRWSQFNGDSIIDKKKKHG